MNQTDQEHIYVIHARKQRYNPSKPQDILMEHGSQRSQQLSSILNSKNARAASVEKRNIEPTEIILLQRFAPMQHH